MLNESKERKGCAKENIEQAGVKTSLNRRNAVFLMTACTAQMFAWSINPGQIDPFKYGLAAVSALFMILLLCSIWFKTGRATRAKLMIRVFAFSVIFNIVVIASCAVAGGFISIAAGILIMLLGLKIV